MRNVVLALAAVAIAVLAAGHALAAEVVIYSSIDRPYLRALMKEYETRTGVTVRIFTDPEGTKTAGLAEKLLAEKANPKADVYWGNEIFHTINLTKQGVLTPYQSPAAAGIPDRWRDKDWHWTAIGLRARVLVVSARPEYAQTVAKIKGIADLTDPALKGRIGVCHPAFGTAAGHFASFYMVLGEERYMELLRGLKANEIKILGGNAAVVAQTDANAIVAGPTDNDDVANGKHEGMQVEAVLPDQNGMGTLLIPTTIGLVHGAPHAEEGKRLIDFLLSPEVEQGLIEGRFLAYSVRGKEGEEPKVKAMNVDYEQAAANMRKAVETALTILQGR